MGLIVTNSISTSTGGTKSNSWLWAKFHTGELALTGKVNCDLYFYNSEDAYNEGKEQIYPIVTISEKEVKVSSAQISFGVGEIVKVGADCTIEDVVSYFYEKLAEKLELEYSWTIIAD